MKKHVSALVAALILTALLLTGCTKMKSVLSVKGEKQNAGYYGFYVHWQRDYMKELLKNAGYDIGTNIDSQYDDKMTVREYIISTAKTRYLSFLVVTRKFDELGLALTEEQKNEIDKMYEEEWIGTYGADGLKNILAQLGLTDTEFRDLLSVQIKSDALLEYYYGENGVTPITAQMKKDYFNQNYLRFKYVLLATQTDSGTPLPESEIETKRALAERLKTEAEQGANFEDFVAQYSEDYNTVTDDMTEEQKQSAQTTNEKAVNEGLICDLDGIFNQTLYEYYDMSVNEKIVTALTEMEIGQVRTVETDNSVWVIKKYDLNESPDYYENRADAIYQTLYGDDFSSKYTRWLAEMDYAFDDAALAEWDPAEFSDLFSEVYNIES